MKAKNMFTDLMDELESNQSAHNTIMNGLVIHLCVAAKTELYIRHRLTQTAKLDAEAHGMSGPDMFTHIDNAVKSHFTEQPPIAEKLLQTAAFICDETEKRGLNMTVDKTGHPVEAYGAPSFPMFFFLDNEERAAKRVTKSAKQLQQTQAFNKAVLKNTGRVIAGQKIDFKTAEALALQAAANEDKKRVQREIRQFELDRDVIGPQMMELFVPNDCTAELPVTVLLGCTQKVRDVIRKNLTSTGFAVDAAEEEGNFTYAATLEERCAALEAADKMVTPLLNEWDADLNEYIENGTDGDGIFEMDHEIHSNEFTSAL